MRMIDIECKECKVAKPLSAFHPMSGRSGSIQQPCKACKKKIWEKKKSSAPDMYNPRDKRWKFYQTGIPKGANK